MKIESNVTDPGFNFTAHLEGDGSMKSFTEITRRQWGKTWYRIWTDKAITRYERDGLLPDEVCVETLMMSTRQASPRVVRGAPQRHSDPFYKGADDRRGAL